MRNIEEEGGGASGELRLGSRAGDVSTAVVEGSNEAFE